MVAYQPLIMILYIFQNYVPSYKYYRYSTFTHKITVIPSMSMWYIYVIHLYKSLQKRKIKYWVCYYIVTWIYTEIKNQNNATKKNFQSSNFSTFYHHLKVNFHLFHWLNLLAQILFWGSHVAANMAALDYKATENSTCLWIHKDNSEASQNITESFTGKN